MPVYLFRCDGCDLEQELLRRLGDLTPPACPACGAPTRHRLARVAVKYQAWGFSKTDGLVASPAGKSFTELSSKADQIADG